MAWNAIAGVHFVHKNALTFVCRGIRPFSSLRSSIHPRIRSRGFLRAASDFGVPLL